MEIYYEGLVRFYIQITHINSKLRYDKYCFFARNIIELYTPNIINNKEIYPHMLIITIDDNTSSIISNRLVL